MTLATIAFAMMLAALAFGVVILPFLIGVAGTSSRTAPESAVLDLRRRRDRIYQALRDLEFDQATGKVSAEDYAELSAEYKRQAIALLKQIDDEQREAVLALDREIENAIAAQRARRAPANPTEGDVATARRRCVACGASTDPSDRFCRRCGVATTATCPKCGVASRPNDRFCGSCGAAL
ncbi:MAG: zinc ribbon domain-containing protein [Dehalococcoidia bacterium]|nr:zinc ribbon domain-containing protein [Dehalococcoidia bacterium]